MGFIVFLFMCTVYITYCKCLQTIFCILFVWGLLGVKSFTTFCGFRVVILMVYLAPLVPFELAQICNVQEMTTQIYFFNNFLYFVCLGA